MKILKDLERMNMLHLLIKKGKTGTPDFLAKHLGLSRASLYRVVEELKSYDAPIIYSRSRETFLYTKDFNLQAKFPIQLIEDENILRKIAGGCKLFPSVSILRRKEHTFTLES